MITADASGKSIFKVLASKGDVKIYKAESDNWEKIQSKQEIFENDKIKVERGAYLGLVHTTGRTVEIKEAGTYNVNELVKKISKKESSLSKRLSQYVFDEISQAEDILSSDDYHKSMSITGSVERSIESPKTNTSEFTDELSYSNIILVNFPKKTNIITSTVSISWEPVNGITNFMLSVRDRFDNEVMKKNVKGNNITIDLTESAFARDNFYIFNISIEDNPTIKSGDFAFQLLSEEKADEIKNEVALLKQELNTESSLADRILLASFYEERGLFIEAQQAYEQAMPEGNDIEEFQNMYKAFLYKSKTGNY